MTHIFMSPSLNILIYKSLISFASFSLYLNSCIIDLTLSVNGYPTNAPSPLKSPTYERTKKFKCHVHSCGSLTKLCIHHTGN